MFTTQFISVDKFSNFSFIRRTNMSGSSKLNRGDLKMLTKLLLGTLFATSFLSYGYSAETPPTELLANILTYFKTAELCDHVTEAFVWHDDYKQWDIRFKATLKPGEDKDKLCECMYGYINQNNWLGAKCDHVCLQSPNCVTLVLKGPASPDFDPKKPPVVKPIASLCSVLKNFKSATLGNRACTSKCRPDGRLTRLELQCELTCNSPNPTEARDQVLNYLNQNGLLTKATITAKSDGKYVTFAVVGE